MDRGPLQLVGFEGPELQPQVAEEGRQPSPAALGITGLAVIHAEAVRRRHRRWQFQTLQSGGEAVHCRMDATWGVPGPGSQVKCTQLRRTSTPPGALVDWRATPEASPFSLGFPFTGPRMPLRGFRSLLDHWVQLAAATTRRSAERKAVTAPRCAPG